MNEQDDDKIANIICWIIGIPLFIACLKASPESQFLAGILIAFGACVLFGLICEKLDRWLFDRGIRKEKKK